MPSKSRSPRSARTSSPSEVSSSSARTAVARLPLPSPEPCVAVATAPATETCGREARLCTATPQAARSPQVRPPENETQPSPTSTAAGARVRDELLDIEQFSCLAEARVVIGDWREDYNQR